MTARGYVDADAFHRHHAVAQFEFVRVEAHVRECLALGARERFDPLRGAVECVA